ncbi:MAG: hypothetical protein PVI40_04120 [Chlamydiota bacterium]|jgi:hypothetical protein
MSSSINYNDSILHLHSAESQRDRALILAKKKGDGLLFEFLNKVFPSVLSLIQEQPALQEKLAHALQSHSLELTQSMNNEIKEPLLKQIAKIGEAIERYNVVFFPAPELRFSNEIHENIVRYYDESQELPNAVHRFDSQAEHTIPLKDYLYARISDTIQHLVKNKARVELFVGPSAHVDHYYAKNGFFKKALLNTRSSIKYVLFENEKGEQKVVVLGISNESKLTHTLLQLKAVGVPMEKISVRGKIEDFLNHLETKLAEEFARIVGNKSISLAVIGNRSGMVFEIAERLYPEEMKGPFITENEREEKAIELLKAKHNYHEINIDKIFKFSTVEVEINGEAKVLVAFRMPNGDLSRIATRVIFQNNQVDGFVMVGAGGSLCHECNVGDYQLTVESSLEDAPPVEIDPSSIMPLQFRENNDVCKLSRKNLTVLSPLVETLEWLNKNKSSSHSVDVETYFIMQAFAEAVKIQQQATKIFPGLFISDQVGGEHPLTEKIDPSNAWVYLPGLLAQSMSYFNVPDNRTLEIEEEIQSSAS